jgi:hypothetical protein
MAIKRGKNGSLRPLTQCGILMHSSLVVTAEGLPLGLAAVKFWTRSRFKGTTALKRHVNPTRVPIEEKESYRWLENMRQSTALLGEPVRCIHVGDRESDIYELFCTAHDLSTYFLVRTCVDRLAGDGQHTIADEMEQGKVKGLHRVEIRDAKGHPLAGRSQGKKSTSQTVASIHSDNSAPPSFVQTLTASVFSLVGCEPNRTRHPSGSSCRNTPRLPWQQLPPQRNFGTRSCPGGVCIPCGYRHDDDTSPLMAHGLGDSAFCIRSDGARAASKSSGWLHTSPFAWLTAPGQTVTRNTGAHRRASGLEACGSTPAQACVPEH